MFSVIGRGAASTSWSHSGEASSAPTPTAGTAPDAPAAHIKSLHNVGGLPAELGFELIDPLRDLFKDEVRRMGLELGLPDVMVWRHPFPGPGLAVRCLGEVTEERLRIIRDADAILIEELHLAGIYREIQQALAERGYLRTEPSGRLDTDTSDALRRFQQDQNLEVSGKLDSLSLIALGLGPKRTASAQARPQ